MTFVLHADCKFSSIHPQNILACEKACIISCPILPSISSGSSTVYYFIFNMKKKNIFLYLTNGTMGFLYNNYLITGIFAYFLHLPFDKPCSYFTTMYINQACLTFC